MVQYCPFCAKEGRKAEIFENALLKRCLDCSADFKFVIKPEDRHKAEKPLKGMKAILG